MSSAKRIQVAIIMGSQSDWPTMRKAADMLDDFDIAYESRIVSAHRTPEKMFEFARTASVRGLSVIIAGAGGAAHLPGMVASLTRLPVLGVPIESRALKGIDSLLSIAQMPGGVPVGTLAIGTAGAKNAALLATLMMLRAEALELSGRVSEARMVRLDSLGWARYGYGADWAVRAKLREVGALSPLKGPNG